MTKDKKTGRKSNSDNIDKNKPAYIIINKFGGLKNFCDASQKVLDKKYATSTVWSWMINGLIPMSHIPNIKKIALSEKVKIKDSDFIPA